MKFKNLLFQFYSISNFFLNIFIVFLFLFFGHNEIAAEGFIVISIANIFTHGFSGNIRNIYLGSENILSLKKTILFRILISFIAVLTSSILIYYFLSKENFNYLFSILILTVLSFILELLIARAEKNNLLNFFVLINIVIFLFASTLLLYFDLAHFLIFSVSSYLFFNFFIFRGFFKSLFFTNYQFIIDFRKNFNIGVYSTFLKTFSNLVWRYSAFILLGDTKSAILFMAFSLGSFFGTIFDISYGALFLKKFNKSVNFFLNTFYFLYCLIIFLLILFFKKFSLLSIQELEYLYITTVFSLIGSYIIMNALRFRQKYFEISSMHNVCFRADIKIYIFNSFIITILYFINKDLVVTSYLVSCIFFYLVYRNLSKIILRNEK